MKPRIAMVTPLPPHPSGIADYSAELLPELAAVADVAVYYIGSVPDPIQIAGVAVEPLADLKEKTGCYEHIILHVANGAEYKPVIDFAEAFPSIVVIHDINISGIYGSAYLDVGKTWRFFSEILRQEGASAFTRSVLRFVLSRKCPGPDEYRMNTSVVKSAKRIIVHSSASAKLLENQHGSLPVSIVPHGTADVALVDESAKSRARCELGLPQEAFIVGAFGTLDERKRIHVLLKALEQLAAEGDDIYCCLVGSGSSIWHEKVANGNLGNNVRLTGRVSIEDFYKYMAAVDLCVNLRNPWLGEESGPLLRIMSSGKPVIVSDTGSFSEIPSTACFKITTGEEELPDLTNTIREAISDRSKLAQMGMAAREYCSTQHTWRQTASGYMNAISMLGNNKCV